MCGRFVSASSPQDVARYFGATLPEETLVENYNVAPTDPLYAIIHGDGAPRMDVFRWGLVPAWAKDKKIAASMINARAETIATKPAFARLFASRRCIVPATGFYEWRTTAAPGSSSKPTKQPYFIHRADHEPLAMAGIWSSWHDPAVEAAARLVTAGIITTAANGTMAPIHDRMPVMLPVSTWERWLDPAMRDIVWLESLLVPAPDELLTLYPVSTDVNSVRNGGARLLEPVDVSTGAEATLPFT
jgi:putative SOS response-associated peptidase YedK